MPPPPQPSNIRAFVHFKEPTVYAGEDVECVITFKNIGTPQGAEIEDDGGLRTPNANGFPRDRQRSYNAPASASSRRASVAQSKPPLSRTPSIASARAPSQSKGHRPTLSLNVVSAPARGGLHSAPLPMRPINGAVRPSPKHGRSLSIMSLGSEAASDSKTPTVGSQGRRPGRGHGRSASLQVSSQRPVAQTSPSIGSQPTRQPSPLYEASTPPALPEQEDSMTIRPTRKKPGLNTAPNTPALHRPPTTRKHSSSFISSFHFPAQPHGPGKTPSPQPEAPKPKRSPSNMHSSQFRGHSPRPPDGWSGALGNLNPITRVMSESSAGGTPRSSVDFYSMSNHSDETLASELPYQTQQSGRLLPKSAQQAPRARQPSYQRPAESETLMMAFAQTLGSFTLDGSLVNAAPFEEVKRKGVQGGGGVVGVERSKRSSGMFGAFSWGNIGESLGGLLGGDEMSSMAQMKASAGSKSVPLLSTPQSLLAVDVRLAPGESKSYGYRFSLPRGLPPSHKGRAIKVAYHLAIGVQRPDGQAVKSVEVPFRVLGSVNVRGETLGHDLMSPYIVLQDAARTQSIATDATSPSTFPPFLSKESRNPKSAKQGLEDFLRYTERLLEAPTDANGALLSPTSPHSPSLSPTLSRRPSMFEQQPANQKEAIDFAILRSNHTSQSGKQKQAEAQSTNRFNIARSGQPVAVLTLLRPAYRLGEAVIGMLDFTSLPDVPQLPTYSILLELESAERVDPSLALRSSGSINRVTRKVHATARESTLFARRISFNLAIPAFATPTFETTGVSLQWRLRVEFTVARQNPGLGLEGMEDGGGELLEELGRDERSMSLIARERIMAETFEIMVPVKVFGAPGVEGLGVEVEGLVV